MAHMDPLTGVYNRRAFDHDWRNLQDLASAQRLDIAFVLFDCDFFKAINDTYGHTVGDQVIQGLAKALQRALRKGDRLYRLGGDEFAALLLNADEWEAAGVGRRCQKAVLEYPFDRLGLREPVRVSVGIAHSDAADPAGLANLQRWADLAMYHAKRNRRERVVQYHPDMDRETPATSSNRVVNAVLEALESGGNIEMHYQPILRLDTDRVEYYEALLRLRDPGGLIAPCEILPVVQRRALEAELDAAVVRQVRADLLSGHLRPDAGVAVNLSGASMSAADLCERLAPLRPFLDRRRIVIEITETDLITQLQHVSESINRLRGQGFTIALDDFGSGYSSIRYLAAMPVDVVKFDITMIRDLERDDRARRIVEHTARLVLHAGYRLVAEGIEHETTLRIVRTLGFTHVQGYLLGRPRPLAELPTAEGGAQRAGVDAGQ